MEDFRALVDNVREQVNLVELISQEVVLKPTGSVLKGRSPFRNDKDPSFVVWPHSQTWRAFSGASDDGGDCFDYVKLRDGVPFMDALRALASGSGLEIPGAHDPAFEAELEQLSERRRVERLLTEAANYYHKALPSKVRASWLKERYGFTDEIIDKLQLGWADGHLYKHLIDEQGATRREALATGLFVRFADGRVVDFFQSRIVFPYWRRGRVVYFIARRTEMTSDKPWEQAKYKKLLTHSDKHPYVSSYVANNTFYNEGAAHGAKQLLITEGVTDCISAMQAGVACISPVTVRFRKKDLPKLIELSKGAKEVIIANDAEESGAGADGAADTANALHAAGRSVRVAILPRPEGTEKIDLNELITKGGPEALKRVIYDANDWCEHLINQIPKDTSHRELNEHLKPVIPLILTADPIMRDAYAALLKKRFKLATPTVNAILRAESAKGKATKRKKRGKNTEEREHTRPLKGSLQEAKDHYFTVDSEGELLRLSNFRMEVNRWIASDDGDIADLNIHTESGQIFHNLRFARKTWNSRHSFISALKSSFTAWTGNDDNVQALLYLLTLQKVPFYRGVKNLGYGKDENGPYWAIPDGLIEPLGEEGSHKDIIWIESGGALHKRISPISKASYNEERALAAEVLPTLLEINTLEVMLPIIGWFFIAPLRPLIFERHRNFPNLCVYGTQGSGKTSLIVKVMWPLIGISSSVPFSCTETEFALTRLLSDTNSIPIFLDEYKPADMPKRRLNAIHRFLRRLYTGEAEQRGRMDLSVVDHLLTAPLVLGGESRPIESALAERMIISNPSKITIEEDPRYVDAFKLLESKDLGLLSRGIIQHLLSRDVEADYKQAAELLNDYLVEIKHPIPHRMRFNLETVIMGLICFDAYALSVDVSLPEINLSPLIKGQVDDLLEGRRQVKSALDFFMEILSSLAVSGDIEYGKQFTYSRGCLAIHISSCHAAYTQHCKRTGYTGEVVDQRALRRLIKENHRRQGYIQETSVPTSFEGTKRRAALIDMDKAKADLEVDDFPQEVSSSSGSSAIGW